MHWAPCEGGLDDGAVASVIAATAPCLRDVDISGHAALSDAGLAALAACSHLTRVRGGKGQGPHQAALGPCCAAGGMPSSAVLQQP